MKSSVKCSVFCFYLMGTSVYTIHSNLFDLKRVITEDGMVVRQVRTRMLILHTGTPIQSWGIPFLNQLSACLMLANRQAVEGSPSVLICFYLCGRLGWSL